MSISHMVLPRTNEGKRICQVIKVKPESLNEYKRVHAAVWPDVLDALKKAHVVDYSIHYFAPLSLLIATMRYVGNNYEADMEGIKESEATRQWWQNGGVWFRGEVHGPTVHVNTLVRVVTQSPLVKITRDAPHSSHLLQESVTMTDGLQESFVDGAMGSEAGEWWSPTEEVFRFEG